MAKKTHQYELISAESNEVVATFWWDGRKVQCDSEHWLKVADDRAPRNKDKNDGVAFLEALPYAFRSGYVNIRNKPDEV